MGVETKIFKIFRLSDGSLANVHIYDTTGQERFRSLSNTYYRTADCCLLVYDITNYQSFIDCKDYYIKNIKEKCKKNIKVFLLGNKTDLEKGRKVPIEEGTSLALNNDYLFKESSCVKNENVAGPFETLIEITNLEKKKNKNNDSNDDNTKEETIKIEDDTKDEKPKKSGCC